MSLLLLGFPAGSVSVSASASASIDAGCPFYYYDAVMLVFSHFSTLCWCFRSCGIDPYALSCLADDVAGTTTAAIAAVMNDRIMSLDMSVMSQLYYQKGDSGLPGDGRSFVRSFAGKISNENDETAGM